MARSAPCARVQCWRAGDEPGHPICTTAGVTSTRGRLIHSFTTLVTDETGTVWRGQAYGRTADNLWRGWIVFTNEAGETVETGVETTQPDRAALEYWASGIEPIYLDGALARARGLPV
jgi:hypothetical protein